MVLLMPDLYDSDLSTDVYQADAKIHRDTTRRAVVAAGFAVALTGIAYGLTTGFGANTLLFTIAGLTVFLALALTCVLDMLGSRHLLWPSRSLLISLLGLSLLRLVGID